MGKNKINWVGGAVAIAAVGLLILGMVFTAAYFGLAGFNNTKAVASPGAGAATLPPATSPSSNVGGPVTTLSAQQMNKYSAATEGSNNLDFWDLNANVADTSKTARLSLPYTSGLISTGGSNVTGLSLTDNQATKDLYVNGKSTYYDDKVTTWHLNVNPTSGVAALMQDSSVGVSDPSGAVVATAVGTFANFTTAYKLDTGVTQQSEGVINLSNASTGSSPYVQVQFGNSKTNSEIRQPVLCIGDLNSKLTGNEFTAVTLVHVSGTAVNIGTTDLMPLLTKAAGTGTVACQSFPDLKNFGVDIYQINFQTVKSKFATGMNFQIIMDDLGGYKARQYPSADLKAATETLTVQYGP